MNAAVWTIGLTWITIVGFTSGYNVLVMMPFSSKSHVFAFQPIAEELTRRGHKVTVASSIAYESKPGLRHVHLQLSENVFLKHKFSFFDGDFSNATLRQMFLDLVHDLSSETYKESFVQEVIKSPRDPKTGQPKYDVLVVDAIFNEYMLPLAYHMGVPSIYFCPGSLFPQIAYALDIPFPLSYIRIGTLYSDKPSMTFSERFDNLVQTVIFFFFRSSSIHPYFDSVVAKYLPGVPPITVLEQNVSFVLQNMKIPLTQSTPRMPYYEEIGTVHCRAAQKLPQDLEDYMQSSGDAGVIYFSLGSYTKGESMPVTMRDKIVEAFAQLPQKFIWKYEKDIDNLPKNIKLVKWAPQQDILGHPKLRLFITHGGSLSTQESAYHGCPLLIFPLSADQLGNAGNAVKSGIAEYLDWKTFTAKDLLNNITLLMKDARYKENAVKVSSMLRDVLVDPKVAGAYWIEYVVRHRGAHHLKSGAGHLNFFQYFLLDVIAVIVFSLLLLLGILMVPVIWIFRRFRKWSSSSSKKKEKRW